MILMSVDLANPESTAGSASGPLLSSSSSSLPSLASEIEKCLRNEGLPEVSLHSAVTFY